MQCGFFAIAKLPVLVIISVPVLIFRWRDNSWD